jgi:hypothetical protein
MKPCEKEEIATKSIDADSNIYPCSNHSCKKFHISATPLTSALKYLQLSKVKEILKFADLATANKMILDELKICTNNPNIKETEHLDIVNKFICELYGTSGSCAEYPTVNVVGVYDMKVQPSPYKKHNHELHLECVNLYCEILDYLCSKYPQSIKPSHFECMNAYSATRVIKILQKYFQDDAPLESSCFVCGTSYSSNLITCTCKCKINVHLQCLIELITKNSDTCKTCLTKFGSKIDKRGRMFFPDSDIYASPLMSSYIFPKTLNDKLHFAIIYMQVNRVKQILQSMTPEQFTDYKNNADYVSTHSPTFYDLISNPYSNYSRHMYPIQHQQISQLLIEKDIGNL